MGKFSLSRERTILLSFVAAFFSVFTMVTISTIPMDNANAVLYITCSQIDASSRGQCDYDRDISEEGFRDCINNVNCFATKNIRWENTNLNTFNGQSEEAKINIDLLQLLNCGSDDCFVAPGIPDAVNSANHNVNVRSLGNSYVDYDVDFEMTQQTDGGGQNNYIQDNFGDQQFVVTARNTAVVDADGDGNDVEFKMNQFNDECDDSSCTNEAYQYDNIVAEGSSRVDLSSDTGFTATQTNNGCDVHDGVPGNVDCDNYSEQGLDIFTLNPASPLPNNRATVIYDTLGPSTTTQSNNCEFEVVDCDNEAYSYATISASGTSVVDMDDVEQDHYQSTDCNDSTGLTGISCYNLAESFINVGATGASRVNVDFAKQDSSQTMDCDNGNGADCFNHVTQNLAIQAAEDPGVAADGVINAKGSQVATQAIDCNGSDCENIADMVVGLGFSTTTGVLNPVTGTLNSNYKQSVTQNAGCNDDAACNNNMVMHYFATALEGSTVTSTSDQASTQSTFCTDKTCNNNGIMINNIFAEDNARLTGTTTQRLTQTCNDTVVGPCNNNNMQTTSGSAINNAIFTYTTGQTLNNGPGLSGNGDQSITLTRSSGTSSQTVTQTQPGQTFP